MQIKFVQKHDNYKKIIRYIRKMEKQKVGKMTWYRYQNSATKARQQTILHA